MEQGRQKKILLTAFRGTSAEVLVKGMRQYKSLIFPNDKVLDSELLAEALELEPWDYVISLGQRPNIKDKVHIETTARKDASYICTSLDWERMKQVFEQCGLKVKISENAGTSFCNELYWNGLKFIQEKQLGTKMVFVHVPFEKNVTDMEEFRGRIENGLEKMIRMLI